jgi:hypothetical protein
MVNQVVTSAGDLARRTSVRPSRAAGIFALALILGSLCACDSALPDYQIAGRAKVHFGESRPYTYGREGELWRPAALCIGLSAYEVGTGVTTYATFADIATETNVLDGWEFVNISPAPNLDPNAVAEVLDYVVPRGIYDVAITPRECE